MRDKRGERAESDKVGQAEAAIAERLISHGGSPTAETPDRPPRFPLRRRLLPLLRKTGEDDH